MKDELSELRRERDELREALAAHERSAALRHAVLSDDLSKLAMRQISLTLQNESATQSYRRECAKVVQLQRALAALVSAGGSVCEMCMKGEEYSRWAQAVANAVEVLTLLEIPF